MKRQLLIVLVFFFILKGYSQKQEYWTPFSKSSKATLKKISNKTNFLVEHDLFKIDLKILKEDLNRNSQSRNKGSVRIKIPTSSTSFEEFDVIESSIMHTDLQNKYPSIRTYKGVGVTDPTATIRFSIGPLGLHALSSSGK